MDETTQQSSSSNMSMLWALAGRPKKAKEEAKTYEFDEDMAAAVCFAHCIANVVGTVHGMLVGMFLLPLG